MTQLIAINGCFGGFNISEEATTIYENLSNKEYVNREVSRSDPFLIEAIQKAKNPNGICADITIVEIPDDVKWQIEEYDGSEWIAEVHRTWR